MDPKLIDRLIQLATKVRENSHAPYSNFQVGAALLASSGQIYTGCNVENSSYGLTNCAERTALFSAISNGERKFSTMAIIADTPEPILPCGACRQVMAEFNPELCLILTNLQGDVTEVNLKDLFPNPFHI